MNDDKEQPGDEQSHGLSLDDICFVLFRHKWMIILFSALGLLATAAVFVIKPPRYRTEAKLFIRYVVEGKALTAPGNENDTPARSLNDQGASILNTELQILKSQDVAREVVDAVGAQRILGDAGGGMNRDLAAGRVQGYLEVLLPANGSVVSVFFEHADAQVAQEVLRKVIVAYVKKHKDMHQTVGMFGEFLNQEIDRLRSDLAQTEVELRAAKSKAGVSSIEEAKKAGTEQISRIRGNLFDAQAELAEREAVVAELTKPAPASFVTTNLVTTNLVTAQPEPPIPLERVNEYKRICAQLDRLSQKEQELLTQFTEQSILVREVREQKAGPERLKQALEARYPRLANPVVASPGLAGQTAGVSVDPTAEWIRVKALKLKIEVLNSQLAQLQAEAARIDEMEDTIVDLQRRRDLVEADLKYFSVNLEQSRIESALGSGTAANIGILQSPSPPVKGWSKTFLKKVAMVAIGPAVCGLVLAFLIELFLDRSVKRPIEVETKLRMPLFISIPKVSRRENRRLARAAARAALRLTEAQGEAAGETGRMEIAQRERHDPLRRFYEGLRNRLIVHFEIWNLKHKPKLVAVTSCGRGAGVTSTAAGLAASLSETGDGSVLLVDMNAEQGATQHFYKGKPACGLEDALAGETIKKGLVHTSLYAVAEQMDSGKLPQALPSRFATLVPKFKASDYDFIIFDMPPVSQTSVTARLAGFMDMVLLVIESEKTSRDVVKRANALLSHSKANVSAVLNKTRKHVPARLYPEFPDEA